MGICRNVNLLLAFLAASSCIGLGSGPGSRVTPRPVASAETTISTRNASGSPASAASPTPSPPPQVAGYTLVFQDDFAVLDISPDGSGNHAWYDGLSYQQIVAPLSNISAANSILTLIWRNGQGGFETTIATSAPDASYYRAWRYGYFEARMNWQNTTMGAWPAFWMLPVEGITGADITSGVTDAGEIDIMEGHGGSDPNTIYGTIHEWQNNIDVYNNTASNAYTVPGGVDLSQYHTYGVLWTPGTVSWYFDNQLVNSAGTTPVFDTQTFYLVLGSQEGVQWTYGDLSGVTAPSLQLQVDWVRVWQ
jgi:hypothetical protein